MHNNKNIKLHFVKYVLFVFMLIFVLFLFSSVNVNQRNSPEISQKEIDVYREWAFSLPRKEALAKLESEEARKIGKKRLVRVFSQKGIDLIKKCTEMEIYFIRSDRNKVNYYDENLFSSLKNNAKTKIIQGDKLKMLKKLFLDEKRYFLSGSSIPEFDILVIIKDKNVNMEIAIASYDQFMNVKIESGFFSPVYHKSAYFTSIIDFQINDSEIIFEKIQNEAF